MYPCTPLWCPSFHFKFITKCLKRLQRWRGFHSLPQNGGRICFGVLSYFILKGNWHLKLRINCLKMGEVFLSKWSHITSSCDINIYRSVMGALSHYLKSDETMICLDVQLYFSPNNADADVDQMLSHIPSSLGRWFLIKYLKIYSSILFAPAQRGPDIDILKPDINILRPDITILRPDIDILRPDIDILRSNIDIILSVCISVCLSICLSFCLSVSLSVSLSVCLSKWSHVPNFVKNMGTKIRNFLSEKNITKYSENFSDSL